MDSQPPPVPPALGDLQGIVGLRILGTCDNYTASSSGGAEKAAHEIYSRWGKAGADVEVISVPFGDPYQDPGVEVVRARGLDLSRFIGGYLPISPDCFRLAAKHRISFAPQVLHANTIHYNGTIVFAHLAAKHRIPFVLTAQLGPTNEMPFLTRTLGGAYDKSVGRFITRRASRVLAVSETVREHMISIGASPGRVFVVENGVDHERFACPPLGAKSDPLILSVGRIVENKGPQLLVEAAIQLHRRGRPVRVGFLGDGPLRPELQRRVDEAGLHDSVVFHGQVSDVEAWLARADIVVRSSFTEGLPLAVLEAMSAGRLNIVSDIPPNRELITDGVNGLTFRTGDSASLADALERAVTDVDGRMAWAAAGRRSSLTRSWDRMAYETAEALLDTAGTGVSQ